MTALNDLIHNKRIEKRLSIPILSEISGVSSSHISRIENGKRKPSAKTLKKLSVALELDYLYLLKKNNLLDKELIDLDAIFQNNICKYKNELLSDEKMNEILTILNKKEPI